MARSQEQHLQEVCGGVSNSLFSPGRSFSGLGGPCQKKIQRLSRQKNDQFSIMYQQCISRGALKNWPDLFQCNFPLHYLQKMTFCPQHTHFMNNDHTQESSNSSAPNFSPDEKNFLLHIFMLHFVFNPNFQWLKQWEECTQSEMVSLLMNNVY